jgi:hypothetical protein
MVYNGRSGIFRSYRSSYDRNVPPRLASFVGLLLLAVIGTLPIQRATQASAFRMIHRVLQARATCCGQGYRRLVASNQPVTHFRRIFLILTSFRA